MPGDFYNKISPGDSMIYFFNQTHYSRRTSLALLVNVAPSGSMR